MTRAERAQPSAHDGKFQPLSVLSGRGNEVVPPRGGWARLIGDCKLPIDVLMIWSTPAIGNRKSTIGNLVMQYHRTNIPDWRVG